MPDTARRRARTETLALIGMSVIVAASAVYAVSWSSGDAAADGDPGSSTVRPVGPTLSPTLPTVSTAPSGTGLALGETFTGSRASSTVSEVEVIDVAADKAPAVGDTWLGLRIKRCSGEEKSSAAAPWSRWVAVDESGESYPGDAAIVPNGVVPRRLTSRDFPADQCRSGWVVIAVPEDVTITSVRLEPPAGPAAEWLVG